MFRINKIVELVPSIEKIQALSRLIPGVPKIKSLSADEYLKQMKQQVRVNKANKVLNSYMNHLV